ncbi:MAG: NAD-dependent epimerase/dehydratase family protein [Azospirillum sp.]|nr:NAD-dependent epimerase/dehydratase family protein [Azospirillum sp.]
MPDSALFFVLGSNSFSGARFVETLLAKGHPVIGASRSDEPHPAFLPYRWQGEPARFRFLRLDLNHNLEAIVDVLERERPAFVVNFAAQSMVAESWQNPDHWFMTNVVSTVRLHDRLRAMSFLERYVHVSTPEVYGSTTGTVREDAPFNPSTPYAVSRAAADLSLRTFHAAYGLPVVYTRAANVYGAGQQLYRIVPRTVLFIRLGRKLQLHGGGTSERSFIHASDVAEATYQVARRGRNGESYHISTDRTISIRGLVELICDRLGVRFSDVVEVVGERLGKDAAYRLDSTKIRDELGWSDQISLEDGIAETAAWVDHNLDELARQPLSYIHKP